MPTLAGVEFVYLVCIYMRQHKLIHVYNVPKLGVVIYALM